MSVIDIKGLKKYYYIQKKELGLWGSVKNLVVRKYDSVSAVDDISFSIKEGELVGFIGPNGAGKTTTLKCLSGLLYPDQGQVSVLGFKPNERKSAFLSQISLVMGQKNQLWWDLPPIETFNLNKEIYRIPEARYKKVLDELVDLLEVEDVLSIQTRKLSLGERMKCELIAALLHTPKVLFLDEPTIGLDVVMQKKIRDFIREYNKKSGATIILTSHYMKDVEELCERVIIIDKGKIGFDGKLENVIKKVVDHKIVSMVVGQKFDPKEMEKVAVIREFSFPKLTIFVKREEISKVVSKILEKFDIKDLNIEEPPIEDVVREIFLKKDYA
ncbi:MAG: ATP-binding cassette domain-containing protein [Armatimonadetes bacterium]|nr:MAG: ATP-binding cassette domain-containing protein [Armatimonadota bacterium]